MVQHEEILYMERIIAFSKFGYDYGIPFHNQNCENMAIRNLVAKDW